MWEICCRTDDRVIPNGKKSGGITQEGYKGTVGDEKKKSKICSGFSSVHDKGSSQVSSILYQEKGFNIKENFLGVK